MNEYNHIGHQSISTNEYTYCARNLKLNMDEVLKIRVPKVIAKIKICGGGLTFTITEDMQFEAPTKEQRENLKKTFGIEVELVDED